MVVNIDFSIFTKSDGAFANVLGEVNLSELPQIGDSLSFIFSEKDIENYFDGVLKVTDRVFNVNKPETTPSILLNDIECVDLIEAQHIVQVIELTDGLYVDIYQKD